MSAKDFVIDRFVRKEELPAEQVAQVLAPDYDRRGHVQHVVLALVDLERSFGDSGGESAVALDAKLARIRVRPVKLATDILPANDGDDFPLQVDQRGRDMDDRVEIVKQ